MSRLVIGVDLSAESERAVAHGVAIARHLGWDATLVLVDAVPDLAATTPASMRIVAERYAAIATARLDRHRAELAALRDRWIHHGPELAQLVVDGYPDERLPAVATELDAALIVVGSHGRTGLKRFFIGSVAERVARRAEVDVLIARGDAPDGGYHRVVVGTDFSVQADQAARHALRYVARGGRLDLAHCWWMPGIVELGAPATSRLDHELHGGLDDELRRASERLRGALADRPDVELSFDLVPAPPAQGLADLAEQRGAELIVVGSHGRRGLRRWILGSVAEVTVRHAPCSVLVAR